MSDGAISVVLHNLHANNLLVNILSNDISYCAIILKRETGKVIKSSWIVS